MHIVLHLSPWSSACRCASTSCRSSSNCVSWLPESSTPVLSTNVLRRNTHFHLVVQRVVSSRHRGQLSVAVGGVTNSSHSYLVFTKALLSCAPDPQETARTSRLVLTTSILRGDCRRSVAYRLRSSTSRSAHPSSARPSILHHSSQTHATRPVTSRPPKPSLSNPWTTCEHSHQMHF